MANRRQLALLRERTDNWNAWRRENLSAEVDLSDAVLARISLTGANLSRANMRGANLTDATLDRATLVKATLIGATLTGANLSATNLTDANLTHATLLNATMTGATLLRTDLTKANLYGVKLANTTLLQTKLAEANLRKASLRETVFSDIDLSTTAGLDGCVHGGPSVLDHRTLLRSRNIPESFLRGCGLPDVLIEYLPAFLVSPIQFYSCFISYSSANQDFADRLYADLQSNGVRCWFAPKHMQSGRKMHEQIDEAIRVYDRLLLILSAESMKSPWVKTEISNARSKEKTLKCRVLFPIRLVPFDDVRAWELFDADIGDSSAKEIREYFLPDFSRWKAPDAYGKAFNALLEALKTDS